MEDTQEIDEGQEVISNKTSEKEEDTRDEVLARHRKEISQLQKKEVEMKKQEARGYSSGNGNEKSNLYNLLKAIAGVTVSSQPENTKVSKAKQRRDKRAQLKQEEERTIDLT
ncbi:hypothetical protein RYX36_031206 [Vicia faba]